jgi:integrase
MIFSFARVSAALSMQVNDYHLVGNRRWIRLREKGGMRHEMPAHQALEEFIDLYISVARLTNDGKGPLFRGAANHDELSKHPMSRIDAFRMVRRRAEKAGLPSGICCHSFRATGITTYLSNGGTLENAQRMAAHKSPRTTKLYDRTDDKITEEEVERIVI